MNRLVYGLFIQLQWLVQFLFEVFVLGAAAVPQTTTSTDVETTTTYVNHNPEVLLRYHDCANYTIPTCGYYSGTHSVTAKLFHNHNPQNDKNLGITYFAVVTRPPTSVS